jgi:DNA-binding NtrC family response regulator
VVVRVPQVLIVDDEIEMCRSLEEILQQDGFRTTSTTDPSTVTSLSSSEHFDAVLLDVKMPEINGIDLLRSLVEAHPNVPVIMITGYPSVDTAVRAMKYGASNYFSKPLDLSGLVREIRTLVSSRNASSRTDQLFPRIVTGDPGMLGILDEVDRAGQVDAPVLITGETGTGKELVAQAIHSGSDRRKSPFVRVNCAAIPESLIESELFGHEAGAFTDAKRQRKGRFEMADGGTLFLDEIGDMSLSTQARILHALQEKTFERVGGSQSIASDIRIVAATNRDLEAMIKEGTFREDLYYRLSVISVRLPPLRERSGDIEVLARHFVEAFGTQYGREVSDLSPEVLTLFRRHTWPGNIRELRNCIERAVIFSSGAEIRVGDLPSQYVRGAAGQEVDGIEERVARLNREIIEEALQKSGGVKSKAADLLDISRRTLYNRMKRLGME